jgi:predicted GNAT family acetyltransferase
MSISSWPEKRGYGKALNAKDAKEEDAEEIFLCALCVFYFASFAFNSLPPYAQFYSLMDATPAHT